MNRKLNIGEMQMWQDAENLVEEIYRQISDAGSYSFNRHLRRIVLAILGNLTESGHATSQPQYCAFLSAAE
ncbi:MAG: four helix bundle protein [Odoribacter sp.]|nr:four helix bundle protein [Odoribacter sp.]